MALAGLVAAVAVGATACSSGSSDTTAASTAPAATTPSTTPGSPAPAGGERGVVTIPMATVGDPGNPSVGVVQTFGGPTGQFVDPPTGTGIYKTCSDAPAAPPPCVTVGAVDYEYGIGAFEVTVSQYVTFLNTVDPLGKNLRQLRVVGFHRFGDEKLPVGVIEVLE